jgi:hypothetical protein
MTGDNRFADDGSMRAELRALDPDLDPLAEARFAAAVAARIQAPGAEGKRAHALALVPVDPFYGLWSLPRPLLVAASIIAVAIAGVASRTGLALADTPATIAESIGVPSQLLASAVPRP